MPLADVLAQPWVTELVGPLLEKHWKGVELLRERAELDRGVIRFDITDQPTEGYNKFIPYYLHPEGVYNVGLSKSSFRTKISVGTNPWTKIPAADLANIAAICERWGGGGHARVGAISFSGGAGRAGPRCGTGNCGGAARPRLERITEIAQRCCFVFLSVIPEGNLLFALCRETHHE